MTGEPPELSVIVPTRDRAEALSACLAALESQHGPSFEIVVVDDASRDTSAVRDVVATAPHARLVQGAGRGPAAARNRGAAEARSSLLCFTDDDCRAVSGWLAALAGRFEAGADVVAGPTKNGNIDDPFAAAAQTITNHLVEASLDEMTGQAGFVPTSNLACRVAVHRSSPFDEHYPLAAGEDREWCERLAAHGIRIEYASDAVVLHHPALSPRRFWDQQERYGRGARRFQRHHPPGDRLQPASFYSSLLRKGFAQGVRVGGLVVLAQVATTAGIARELLAERRRGSR